MDQILTEDEARDVIEKILPAQNQSFQLGLKLKLPVYEVQSIHDQYQRPQDRLLHIIIAFLRNDQPAAQHRPTWRVIVDALKSKTVGFPALAREVEAAHYSADNAKRRDETTGTYQLWLVHSCLCVYHFRHRVCIHYFCTGLWGQIKAILSTEPCTWWGCISH